MAKSWVSPDPYYCRDGQYQSWRCNFNICDVTPPYSTGYYTYQGGEGKWGKQYCQQI